MNDTQHDDPAAGAAEAPPPHAPAPGPSPLAPSYKSFPVHGVALKSTDGDGTKRGELEAIVAVFNNVDAGNERIIPGFFARSIKAKLPKGVWMHDHRIPVAKTVEARELAPGDPMLPRSIRDLGGLYIKALFNLGTQRGREAFSDIEFGTIDEFSIGYLAEKTRFDDASGVLDLVKGRLLEWSPVLAGMNPATALLGVKSQPSKSQSPGGPESRPSFDALASRLATDPGEFLRLVTKRHAVRQKDGRVLSAANRNLVRAACDAMRSALDPLEELYAATGPRMPSGADEHMGEGKAGDAPETSALPPPVTRHDLLRRSLRLRSAVLALPSLTDHRANSEA